MKFDVAFSADKAYVPHVATSLTSLLHNSEDPSQVRIHFLYQKGLDEKTLRRLERYVVGLGADFQAHPIAEQQLEQLPVTDRISVAMWNRIFLPDLLPNVERVLYVDADTIIMQPLDELWQLDLDGFALAAVDNVLEKRFQSRPCELGFATDQSYFNSGVLLINLDWWRERGVTHDILTFATDRTRVLLWPDQDALNVLLGKHRLPLSPSWNAQNSLFFLPLATEYFSESDIRRACKRPAILHFEGPGFAKPWHFLCVHPYKVQYRKYRRKTPWRFYLPFYGVHGIPKKVLLKQCIKWLMSFRGH